jgi:hypothetical protein
VIEQVRLLVVVLAAVTRGLVSDRAAPAAALSLEPPVAAGSAGSAGSAASTPPAAPEPPDEPEANYAVAW